MALGLLSEKVVRQSWGKASKMIVFSYGGRAAETWWEKIKNNTIRFDNLRVMSFLEKETCDLGELAKRSMKVLVTIQDAEVMIRVGVNIVYVTLN